MKILTAVLDAGHVEQVAPGPRFATARLGDPLPSPPDPSTAGLAPQAEAAGARAGNGRAAPSRRGLAAPSAGAVRRRRRRTPVPALTEKETAVLRLRFEDTRRVATPQEVARLLGMSMRTVRRIEGYALRKLRLSALGPVALGFDGWDEA
jgi:DNA-binding CsgD family transcriptional regulator